jgi:hypothetical protein
MVKSINLELNPIQEIIIPNPRFTSGEWQEIVIPLKTCIPRLEEEN